MKIKKEIKAGLIAIAAIGLLVTGINFLKGYSFFGGDAQYTAYFPNAGGLTPSTSVYGVLMQPDGSRIVTENGTYFSLSLC